MSHGSLYHEFDNAKAVARARVWPSWARIYPALRPDRWYRVWDVGQDAHGVFIDAGQPRYVSRDHVQIERMASKLSVRVATAGCQYSISWDWRALRAQNDVGTPYRSPYTPTSNVS